MLVIIRIYISANVYIVRITLMKKINKKKNNFILQLVAVFF